MLLLRPSVQQPADDSLPLDALQAFATCSSTLELQPIDVGGKTRSAVQWLYDLLPAWSSSMQVSFDQTKKSSAYFDDVPFSHDECDAAWRQLFAFEDNDQGFRPAEKELLDLWRSLKQCTDVTGPFKLEDVYAAMRESDFPPGIIEAVVLSPLTDCLQRDTFSFQEGATVSWLWKLLKSLEAADDSIAHDLEEILPPEWHATGQDVSSKTASPNVTANLANIGVDEKTAKEARQNNTGAAKRIGKQTNWHEKFKRPKK